MNKGSTALGILAGASAGSFLGLLMGLSASPVVATVLGGFAAVLAGFLGITTAKTDPPADGTSAISPNASALRVLGFGFSCSFFLLAGIAVRTHDLLAPPLSAQAQALNVPLLSSAEQKQLLFYKAFGLSAAAADGSHLTQADEKKSTAASGSSVLFATQANCATPSIANPTPASPTTSARSKIAKASTPPSPRK